MRIDVSEIKEFRNCKRKWAYTSRNKYHLTNVIAPTYFLVGTVFHECLHMLYTGTDLDTVHDYIERHLTDDKDKKVMYTMVDGYYLEVLLPDLDAFEILDIEKVWGFSVIEGIDLCGSIDMIALKHDDNCIYGFEHKSTARFKESVMIRLDEQLRLYSVALHRIIDEINRINGTEYGYGGLYLNEVRKLQKNFEHKRTLCAYTDEDLYKFMNGIDRVTAQIVAETCEDLIPDPQPSPMKCTMCNFASICEKFAYEEVSAERIVTALPEEYIVRVVDHLDEKQNRSNDEE